MVGKIFFSPPQLCINWAWKFFLRVQRVPAIVKYPSFNCRAVSKRSPRLCRKAWRWDCLRSGNFKSLSRFFSFFPQCNHCFLVLNIVQLEKNFPRWDRPAELSPTFGAMLRGSHWDVLRELHTNIFITFSFKAQQCSECGERLPGSTCRPSLVT